MLNNTTTVNYNRKVPLYELLLQNFVRKGNSPIWDAYEFAFEKMFAEPLTDVQLGSQVAAIRLYPNHQEGQTVDWHWYVTERNNDTHEYDASKLPYTESKFFNILFPNDINEKRRLIYIKGHTGVGKSTFLHYFFRNYIPIRLAEKKYNSLINKLIVIKIPLLFHEGADIPQIWDKIVYNFMYDKDNGSFSVLKNEKFLMNIAAHILGQMTLEKMKLELAKETTDNDTKFNYVSIIKKIITTYPKDTTKVSIFDWLKNMISPNQNLTFGDFNEAVIQLMASEYQYNFIMIVDNIDQLSLTVQSKIVTIVHQKMSSYEKYKRITFLICVRDCFYEPIQAGLFAAAYPSEPFHLGAANFSEILKLRKKYFFDKNLHKCFGKVFIDKNLISTLDVDGFLEVVFERFTQTKDYSGLAQIANYNYRRLLDIVKTVFQSPLITQALVYDIAVASQVNEERKSKQTINNLISFDRIIDLLVRRDNELIAEEGKCQLPNVFFSGKRNHYSSTLTRLFILQIMDINAKIDIKELISILESLGHNRKQILWNIEELLKMQVLYSNYGHFIREDENIQQFIETRDLPMVSFLLDKVFPKLIYMQSMSFVTPLEEDLLEEMNIPEQMYQHLMKIDDRIHNAILLYEQIKRDMELQFNNLGKHQNGRSNWDEYHLSSVINKIYNGLWADINILREMNQIEKDDPWLAGKLLQFGWR